MNTFLAILLSLALSFCGLTLPEACETAEVYSLSNISATVNGTDHTVPQTIDLRLALSRSEALAKLALNDEGSQLAGAMVSVRGDRVFFSLGGENAYYIESPLLTQLTTLNDAKHALAVSDRILSDVLALIAAIRTGEVDPLADLGGAEVLNEKLGIASKSTTVTVGDEDVPATEKSFDMTIGKLVDLLDILQQKGGVYEPVTSDILELAGGEALGMMRFADLKAALPAASAALGVKLSRTSTDDGAYDAGSLSYTAKGGAALELAIEKNAGDLALSFEAPDGMLGRGYSLQLDLREDGGIELNFMQSEDGEATATVSAEGSRTTEEGALTALELSGSLDIPCFDMTYDSAEEGAYSYITRSVSADFEYDLSRDEGLSNVSASVALAIVNSAESFDGTGEAQGEPVETSDALNGTFALAQSLGDDDSVLTDVAMSLSAIDLDADLGFTLTSGKEPAADPFEGLKLLSFTEGTNEEAVAAVSEDLTALLEALESFTAQFEGEEESAEEEGLEEEATEGDEEGLEEEEEPGEEEDIEVEEDFDEEELDEEETEEEDFSEDEDLEEEFDEEDIGDEAFDAEDGDFDEFTDEDLGSLQPFGGADGLPSSGGLGLRRPASGSSDEKTDI